MEDTIGRDGVELIDRFALVCEAPQEKRLRALNLLLVRLENVLRTNSSRGLHSLHLLAGYLCDLIAPDSRRNVLHWVQEIVGATEFRRHPLQQQILFCFT